MRTRSIRFVMATALLLASGSALADTAASGWYVTGGAGVNFLSDIDVHGTPSDAKVASRTGWLVSGAAGYAFTPLRAEIEMAYRRNALDNWKSGGTQVAGSGRIGATTVMLNGYWDFDQGNRVVPYVGVGLGVVRVDAGGWGGPAASFGAQVVSDRKTLFAAQGIIGAYALINPNLRVNVDYRYLRSAGGSFDTVGGGSASFHLSAHSLMAGVSYHFGP